MALPTTLRWIEVDLPELLAYKDEALAGEQPRCVLERVPLDLADVPRRRALFAQIGASAKRVMIVSEGLLIYLSTEEVAALAADLATPASFHYWAFDVVSPGLLEMMRKQGGGGDELARAGAPLKFAPPEGPDFFRQFGWTPLEVRSAFKVASKVGRLPWSLKPFGLFPESNSRQGKRPWSGFCLCERSAGA
jgi:O-methyltransferase involved in polyketide biosynthesis